MRIDLHAGPQQVPENDRNPSAHNSSPRSSSAAGMESGQDQTLLSGAHVQVQALVAQVSQLPEIRAEKVQALRQAVHSGNYHAAAEKTAGALVSHMTFRPVA